MLAEMDEMVSYDLKRLPNKTSDSLLLKDYFQFVLSSLDMLLTFHINKGYRDLRLPRYVGLQMTLQKLCDYITAAARRSTLIGFGDWGNRDVVGFIKKCVPLSSKATQEGANKRCTIVSIGEFRSSKLHEHCHEPLKIMKLVRKCKDGLVRTV